jgi:phosphoserine phosphatase RsbU/P
MSTAARQLPEETDRVTRAIFEHASLISREQQLEELVRLNADFARDLAQAQHCSLWLVDERKGQLWTEVARGTAPIRIPLGEGAVGRCVSEDKVLLVNDALDGDVGSPHWITGFATQQMLCVPLRVEGRVIGALEVLNKPRGFTERDAELLGLLAHFAANAVESKRLRQEAVKARMMEHELSLAMDVQQHLLPQEQECVPGLECVGFCRPAKSVGGDYYDMLPLPSGSFAFTLGDVSGKGIPAAVMMASIQTLLHNLLQREPVEVAAVVSDLNRTLFGCSVPDRYSTLFCALIPPDRRSITYVNAGHVPPLLLHADGRITTLEGGGMPVAMIPDWEYQQFTVELRPGDLLVVVSDGIMEARNPDGVFWDDKEVPFIVRQHRNSPVKSLPAALCAHVDAWAAGTEQYDDMTVVGLRVRG